MIEIEILSTISMKETDKAWSFLISKKFYTFPKSQCKMKDSLTGYRLLVPKWLMNKPPLSRLVNGANVKFF